MLCYAGLGLRLRVLGLVWAVSRLRNCAPRPVKHCGGAPLTDFDSMHVKEGNDIVLNFWVLWGSLSGRPVAKMIHQLLLSKKIVGLKGLQINAELIKSYFWYWPTTRMACFMIYCNIAHLEAGF